jgi:hypothetical protein
MKTLDLDSWSAFVTAIERLKTEYGLRDVLGSKERNVILFRGQAEASWKLETTLERFSTKEWTSADYALLVWNLAPRIESFTDRDWRLPSDIAGMEALAKQGHWASYQVPCYEYWSHLRHHGFPSPLLDWTASPYVAAFFAMADQRAAERAAVFAYIEMPTGGKSGWQGAKIISVQGPNVRTHKRHFLQQSWYSVCTRLEGREFKFSCHEDVFAGDHGSQDVLYKITLPRAERLDILRHLQEMNINAFSLFQTEDALMETLAVQDIELETP